MSVEDIFELLVEAGHTITAEFTVDDLTNLLIESDIDIAEFSDQELDNLLAMCSNGALDGQAVDADPGNNEKCSLSFGAAGKCYACYGTGVIWNFSEGKNEKCHVCGGSGIGSE